MIAEGLLETPATQGLFSKPISKSRDASSSTLDKGAVPF